MVLEGVYIPRVFYKLCVFVSVKEEKRKEGREEKRRKRELTS